MAKTGRINLIFPLEVMINIEKECDKRGIKRTQFIQEAVAEKLKSLDVISDIQAMKNEIRGIKEAIFSSSGK